MENQEFMEYVAHLLSIERIPEPDWKLFRKKLPVWQTNYIEKLFCEYRALLDSDMPTGDKFWKLERRINRDKRSPGVIVELSRSKTFNILTQMVQDGIITMEDLDDFSDDLYDIIAWRTGNAMRRAPEDEPEA